MFVPWVSTICLGAAGVVGDAVLGFTVSFGECVVEELFVFVVVVGILFF